MTKLEKYVELLRAAITCFETDPPPIGDYSYPLHQEGIMRLRMSFDSVEAGLFQVEGKYKLPDRSRLMVETGLDDRFIAAYMAAARYCSSSFVRGGRFDVSALAETAE